MLFPSASFGGVDFRLLLIRPQVSQAKGNVIEVGHRFDTSIGVGRTTIEERRPRRSTLLLSQRCTIPLVGNAADDWRKGIAALGKLPVAMPLWIDALPAARWAERIYDPQVAVNFDPTSGAFTIYNAGAIPGVLPYSHLAPLMLGRWDKRPTGSIASRKYGEVEIILPEKRPWSWRIGINAYGAGWNELPDWSGDPVIDETVYDLEQTLLEGAASSEPILDAENAASRWRQEAGFTFRNRLAIRTALTHFVAKKGAWLSWSPVPAWFKTGADTPATPYNYTARFEQDILSLRYISGAVATATTAFLQEIDTGARSQALAAEAFLYALTYQRDPTNPERYTNWDAPIVDGAETFQPDQCVHSELNPSLRPQDLKAELKLGRKPGSLAADWFVGRLSGWVRLDVWSCDPANVAATRKKVLTGFVDNVLPDGNVLSLSATQFGKGLDRNVPGDVFGKSCNTYLCSPDRCKLTEAAVLSTGTIAPADLSADGSTLTIHGAAGFGGPAYADHWFAPNGILRTGAGRQTQLRMIMSSAMSGGNLVITVNRPLWADMIAGGGQGVTLIPSCEGQYDSDCGTKFNNQVNFHADPFMEDTLQTTTPGAPSQSK